MNDYESRKETLGQIAFRYGEYLDDDAFNLLCDILLDEIENSQE